MDPTTKCCPACRTSLNDDAYVSARTVAEALLAYSFWPQPDGNPPCDGCGGPHPFDTVVPSVRWNAVIRKAGLPEYLCLTCIVSAFVKAGESFTAELVGGDHHFEPIEILPRKHHNKLPLGAATKGNDDD